MQTWLLQQVRASIPGAEVDSLQPWVLLRAARAMAQLPAELPQPPTPLAPTAIAVRDAARQALNVCLAAMTALRPILHDAAHGATASPLRKAPPGVAHDASPPATTCAAIAAAVDAVAELGTALAAGAQRLMTNASDSATALAASAAPATTAAERQSTTAMSVRQVADAAASLLAEAAAAVRVPPTAVAGAAATRQAVWACRSSAAAGVMAGATAKLIRLVTALVQALHPRALVEVVQAAASSAAASPECTCAAAALVVAVGAHPVDAAAKPALLIALRHLVHALMEAAAPHDRWLARHALLGAVHRLASNVQFADAEIRSLVPERAMPALVGWIACSMSADAWRAEVRDVLQCPASCAAMHHRAARLLT